MFGNERAELLHEQLHQQSASLIDGLYQKIDALEKRIMNLESQALAYKLIEGHARQTQNKETS